jgi:hypothetical protein
VRLTRLALSAEPDLSFLASIEVYVSAEGLSELRVASSGSFPEGQPTVELVLEDAELADFVVAGGMSFRAAVTGTPPTDDTVLTVEVEAEVEATAQGACNAAKG